jgi:hypothetical protein
VRRFRSSAHRPGPLLTADGNGLEPVVKNPDAGTGPSNHLHLMASGDDLSKFWSDGLGLAADHRETIFAIDFIRRQGVRLLYDLIDRTVAERQISVLLIDIGSPLYDPYVIADLRRTHGLDVPPHLNSTRI